MTETIELGEGFYLLHFGGDYYLGMSIDNSLFEFVIPENIYKSLKRREGRVF